MALSVGQQIRWWTIGLLVFGVILWLLADAILPFLAGAAIAYFLDPLADRLEARGLSRVLATTIISFFSFGLLLLLMLILVPALIDQARQLIQYMPSLADNLRGWIETRFPEQLDEGSILFNAFESMRENAQSWSIGVLKSAWVGGLALIDFLTLIVITPVVAFYLLMDWDEMVARVDSWLPLDHAPTIRSIAAEVDRVLAGFVRGQLTVCAILGGLYAVALIAVGLQFGLVIGLFAGLISFIPFIGSIFGGALSIGVAVFQFWDDPVWIAVIAVIFVAGQAIEGNFLTPKLVGGSVGLHPVWLMFALSAFGVALGFTGLLIAVPAAAVIGVLARFGLSQYLQGRLYKGVAGRQADD